MNTGRPRALAIKSSRRLNSGEWQKIWIDYNQHHVRFMINTDYEMVDLLPEEEFGPFEGSMFIGGATEWVQLYGSAYLTTVKTNVMSLTKPCYLYVGKLEYWIF